LVAEKKLRRQTTKRLSLTMHIVRTTREADAAADTAPPTDKRSLRYVHETAILMKETFAKVSINFN